MKCEVAECDNDKSHSKYCNKHYIRFYRHGNPNIRTKVAKGEWENVKCSVDDCDRNVRCKGICSMHYSRDQRLKYKGLP